MLLLLVYEHFPEQSNDDENDEIIPNAKVYEYKKVESENLITQDNPNSYIEIEEDSQYIGGYYGGEFFLDQESKEFKLEVTNVQTEEIRVKTVAVQKEVI